MYILKKSLFIIGFTLFITSLFAQSVEQAGAKYNEGNAAMKEKKYAAAIASYEEALKTAEAAGPDAADLKGNIEGQLMSAYTKSGLSAYKKKNYDASITDLDKGYVLATQMGDTEMQKKLTEYIAKIRSAKGMSLLADNKLNEAFAEFDKAHEVKSNCAISFYGKGLVFKEKGDYDKMMESMDQAIKAGTEDSRMSKYADKAKEAAAKALVAEATVEITQEHGPEAVKLLNDSFKYESPSADAYYYLTIAHNKSQQFDEAAEAANKAISMKEGDKSDIYFELGQALEGKGDTAGACDAYKNVKTGPNVDAAKYQITQTLKCG